MFIEDLWAKNHGLLEREVKRVCRVDETKGDKFSFVSFENGVLRFSKYGTSSFEIFVDDFDIKLSFYGGKPISIPTSKEWKEFMTTMFEERYINRYVATREAELKNYVKAFKTETEQTSKDLTEVLETNTTKF